MEFAEKGPIMTLDIQNDVDPVPLELCHAYFRDIVLGVEYCKFFYLFFVLFNFSLSIFFFFLSFFFFF